MAYLNSKDVQAIRTELKAAFPEFKFGVRKNHHSSVTVTIKSGPRDFADIFTKDEYSARKQYVQLNTYHLDSFYGAHAKTFKQMVDIIKTAPARGEGYHRGTGYYNNSNAQIDYFDTAYYFDLHIGAWNKPYELVNAKPVKSKKTRSKKTVTVKARAGTVGYRTITEVSNYNPRDNVAPDPTFSYEATIEQLKAQI
jgi:hypothetical protein